MRLKSVSLHKRGESVRLLGEVESEQGAFELYFQYPAEYEGFVAPSADAFAVAMLVPAMLRQEPLEITPPISPQLHFQLPRIRDIFHTWFPDLAASDVLTTAAASSVVEPCRRAATCFSGGVDSFYTLLKYRGRQALPSPLTHLVFMRGLEKPLDELRDVEGAQRRVETIAERAGVRCIFGESNLRSYFGADWVNLYSGSALAATGLSLANGFGYFCIPSPYSYCTMVPTSTTPLVDERYSTERVMVLHDGAELTRAQKTARIVEWEAPLVLEHLRVCVMNRGGPDNCCACRKCVRTMIALKSFGAFDRAETFPNKSTRHWERVASLDSLTFLQENLDLARARQGDPTMTALLEKIVARRKRKDAVREFMLHSPLRGMVPVIQAVRRRLWGSDPETTLTTAAPLPHGPKAGASLTGSVQGGAPPDSSAR